MTNTLHRFGDAESFNDDYIVFAIPSKSNKDPNALPKLHRFLEIALEYKPVNLGETRHGGALRPAKNLGPWVHWNRDMKPDFQGVIKGLTVPTTCAAVFDNAHAAEQFVKRIKEENLGMSVNISASIEGAERCCNYACLDRHSVGYSLGFEGKTKDSQLPGHYPLDHVRARHDQSFAGQENDRLRKGKPPEPGAGGHLPVTFLLLWYLQSGACQEDS
jgi:hypothetical protein